MIVKTPDFGMKSNSQSHFRHAHKNGSELAFFSHRPPHNHFLPPQDEAFEEVRTKSETSRWVIVLAGKAFSLGYAFNLLEITRIVKKVGEFSSLGKTGNIYFENGLL